MILFISLFFLQVQLRKQCITIEGEGDKMLKIMYLILYIALVIAPVLYFLYLLKEEHILFKIFTVFMAVLSTIGILLKFNIKPYNPLFDQFVYICQFFTWAIYLLFILVFLYRWSFRFIKRRPYRKGSVVICIIAFSLTIIGFQSAYVKQETKYHITISKQSTMSSLKICLLSDMHLGSGTYLAQVKSLVKKVNTKDYDLVLLAGDLFDESTPQGLMDDALKQMSHFHSTYGTYVISGNHEYYGHHTDFSIYKKYHMRFLDNEYVCVKGLFNIVGFTDATSHDSYSIKRVIRGMNTKLPTITMDHNPNRYASYLSFTDLQVSGHTHDGQIFPGNLILRFVFHNSYGVTSTQGKSLIVSSGYGTWGFPFRLGTKSEAVTISVSFS